MMPPRFDEVMTGPRLAAFFLKRHGQSDRRRLALAAGARAVLKCRPTKLRGGFDDRPGAAVRDGRAGKLVILGHGRPPAVTLFPRLYLYWRRNLTPK